MVPLERRGLRHSKKEGAGVFHPDLSIYWKFYASYRDMALTTVGFLYIYFKSNVLFSLVLQNKSLRSPSCFSALYS